LKHSKRMFHPNGLGRFLVQDTLDRTTGRKVRDLAPSITDLYRRLGPVVYRRACSLLQDKEEAWDITQETFVAFMEKHARVENESAAFPLLYTIATNLAFTRLRKRAHRLKPLVQQFTAEMSQGGANEIDIHRVESALELALLTRGESCQAMTVALLYFVEGCTVTEVSDALGLSRRTVRRLLDRFLVRARKRGIRLGGETE
jgi:RNA polymerase sigma factor (sigma-70 family)